MKIDAEGVIVKINPTQEKNGFVWREVYILIDGEKKPFCIKAIKEKAENVGKYTAERDRVEVSFYLNGSEAKDGRVFNNLNLAFIKKIEATAAAPEKAPEKAPSIDFEEPPF